MADVWTIDVTDKRLTDGIISVDVVFKRNGNMVIQDTIRKTDPGEDDSWFEREVRDRTRQLKATRRAFTAITVGPYTLPDPTPDPAVPEADPARQAYLAMLRKFYSYEEAIRIGVLQPDNAGFLALKVDLAANFALALLPVFNRRG